MDQVLERIMTRYGQDIIWQHDGQEEALRGFFQPVTSRSWQKLLREVAPLGEVPVGLYVYFGPVSMEVERGDMLLVEKRYYQVRRTETVYGPQGPAYLWGLCARKGE